MNRATVIVLALVAAFAGGTLSAGYTLSNWLSFYGQQSGPWARLATIGQADADPYTRAFDHISGKLPLGSAEGQIYVAALDSENQTLNGSCTYTLTGEIPPARLFTIHLVTNEGQKITAKAPLQSAMHSDGLLFRGSIYTVAISPAAQPDNWIALQYDGPFQIILTYYDVAAINDDTGTSTPLPRIIKGSCKND